eukprot:scaffold1558_cov403-Prasinococcus_capsulatus_cf.AAC.35
MLASLNKDEGQKFLALEPQVRLRLVLAALQTVNSSSALSSSGAKQELKRFAELAEKDEDDWVRLFGHAVEDFNGRVSISAMAKAMPAIQTSLEELEKEIKAKGGPKLETIASKYLGVTALSGRGVDSEQGKVGSCRGQPPKHFQVREGWQPDPLPTAVHSAHRHATGPVRSAQSLGTPSGLLQASHRPRSGGALHGTKGFPSRHIPPSLAGSRLGDQKRAKMKALDMSEAVTMAATAQKKLQSERPDAVRERERQERLAEAEKRRKAREEEREQRRQEKLAEREKKEAERAEVKRKRQEEREAKEKKRHELEKQKLAKVTSESLNNLGNATGASEVQKSENNPEEQEPSHSEDGRTEATTDTGLLPSATHKGML